jgi:hypothetical protein
MKITSLILAVLILFSGCTTVPSVTRVRKSADEGTYIVRIYRDYAVTAEAVKYAINEFVKSKKHESYDAEVTKTPGFFTPYYEYTITVPGSTPVENLPKVRVFDRSGTELLLYVISVPIGILLIVGAGHWFFSLF